MAQPLPSDNALAFLLHVLFYREYGHGSQRIYQRRLASGRRMIIRALVHERPYLFTRHAHRRYSYYHNWISNRRQDLHAARWLFPFQHICQVLSIYHPTAEVPQED